MLTPIDGGSLGTMPLCLFCRDQALGNAACFFLLEEAIDLIELNSFSTWVCSL
jgi:hypothetical protein